MRNLEEIDEALGVLEKLVKDGNLLRLSENEIKEIEKSVLFIAEDIDKLWLEISDKKSKLKDILSIILGNSKGKRVVLEVIVMFLIYEELKDIKVKKSLITDEQNKEILRILSNAVKINSDKVEDSINARKG